MLNNENEKIKDRESKCHAANEKIDDEIYEQLTSDDIITAVYATRACAVRKLNGKKYVDALKKLKAEEGQYWFRISKRMRITGYY